MDFDKIKNKYDSRSIQPSPSLWDQLEEGLDDTEEASDFSAKGLGSIVLGIFSIVILASMLMFLFRPTENIGSAKIDFASSIPSDDSQSNQGPIDVAHIEETAPENPSEIEMFPKSNNSNPQTPDNNIAQKPDFFATTTPFEISKLEKENEKLEVIETLPKKEETLKYEYALKSPKLISAELLLPTKGSEENISTDPDDEVNSLLASAFNSIGSDKMVIDIVQNIENLSEKEFDQIIAKVVSRESGDSSQTNAEIAENENLLIDQISREILQEVETELYLSLYKKVYLAVQKKFKNRKTSKSS